MRSAIKEAPPCIFRLSYFDSNCEEASLAQWLARQTSNLKAASSSLARGAILFASITLINLIIFGLKYVLVFWSILPFRRLSKSTVWEGGGQEMLSDIWNLDLTSLFEEWRPEDRSSLNRMISSTQAKPVTLAAPLRTCLFSPREVAQNLYHSIGGVSILSNLLFVRG